MNYVPRLMDGYVKDILSSLSAVAIDGCKAVGKTELASRLAASQINLDDDAEVEALKEDPDRIMRLSHPLLIDEWQLWPDVWDRVRRAVDREHRPSMFLLTGSATPLDKPKHSGAGRIVHTRLRPFSIQEREMATPIVSLEELLSGSRPQFHGDSQIQIEEYADEITKGGLPGLRSVPPRLRRLAWDGYLAEVLDRDLPELGHLVRRRDTLRQWLRSYARATASTATYTDILDNATPGDSNKPAKGTTLAWRELLHNVWLVDPLPAWDDPLRHLTRLSTTPKHHLADPALAAHLQGLTAQTLLLTTAPTSRMTPRPGTPFGALFESLVTLSVRVYAEPLGATVSHLRTKDGDHEVDLIVTRHDGACVAMEVKSSPTVDARDVKHLRWLRDRLGSDLLDAAVITTGPAAYRRSEDGIGVIPASLLGCFQQG